MITDRMYLWGGWLFVFGSGLFSLGALPGIPAAWLVNLAGGMLFITGSALFTGGADLAVTARKAP